MRDDSVHESVGESTTSDPTWVAAPSKIPPTIAPKLFEGLPDEIRRIIEDIIKDFAAQALGGLTQRYHEVLTVSIRQNVQAFSNERLAELAGYVNAEINRRAG